MSTATRTQPDLKITHPLTRLRSFIRLFVLADVVLFVGLFLALWCFLSLAFDFGLFKLAGFDLAQQEPRRFVRGTFLFAFVALVVGLVAWRVYGLLTKDFSYSSLALLLEKRHPQLLGDRLITAVELADVKAQAKYGYSVEMIEHTIEEARERVEKVSLSGVFNWKRLINRVVAVAALLLFGVVVALAAHAIATKSFAPGKFANRFIDVASIWGERNLFLMNTPWPRRAYVEIIETDPLDSTKKLYGDNGTEMRVPKGTSPVVYARVYKWVHVDRTSRDGWRPLRWADLDQKTLGFAPPPAFQYVRRDGDNSVDVSLESATLDEIELRVSSGELRDRIFSRLNEIAEDPAYSRKIRRLETPAIQTKSADETAPAEQKMPVQVEYKGVTTGNPLISGLNRDESGLYSGTLQEKGGPIKESVTVKVTYEDFETQPKLVTLVPPPVILKLERSEEQPAYLYHRAPTDGDQTHLVGLTQYLPPRRLSLTGDRTVFTVPVGTGVVLMGTADKPLRDITMVPKGPGMPLPVKEVDPATPDQFTFKLLGDQAIRAKSDYVLTLTDADKVQSVREIEISVAEDKPPEVEVGIDVIRKVGNDYWCTPKARIPFIADSFIKDDTGLRDVRYFFTWRKVESQIIDQTKSLLAAGLSNAFGSPIRTWGLPLSVIYNNKFFGTYSAVSQSELKSGSIPVDGFVRDYNRLPTGTKAALTEKLRQDPTQGEPGTVKMFTFKELGSDVFDLLAQDKGVPALLLKDSIETQPRYQIELSLEATDANTDFRQADGKVGKMTRSTVPIRILVVPEEDLLAKISEDEEKLSNTAEDSVRRSEDARGKLNPELSQLSQLTITPMQFESSSIRLLDVMQDIAKAKDLCLTIQTDITRVIRELEYNRFGEAVLRKWQTGYQDRVQSVLRTEFPQAESAVGATQAQLANKQKPSEVDLGNTRDAVERLVRALTQLRSQFGEVNSLNKEILRLNNILRQQKDIEKGIVEAKARIETELRQPNIAVTKQYPIKAGQKATLTLPIKWGFYIPEKGELKIRVEAPADSELKVPSEVIAKDDRDDYKLEITAGTKTGIFTITLTPLVGKPTDLRIEVQK